MQLAGDADLAAAIEASDRTIFHRFLVDWDRDGSYDHTMSDLTEVVSEISVERALNGALPQETTLVEGYASADLKVLLVGKRAVDSLPISTLLSSWASTGPLWGQGRPMVPCKWEIAVRKASGAVTYMRQFTGYIVEHAVKSDSSGGSVRLSARDGAEALRAALTLPLFGARTASADVRINSQSVIDFALRGNGIYQSPPPQAGCIFSVPGHGSALPEIGVSTGTSFVYGTCTVNDPAGVSGLYGLAINGTPQFASGWAYTAGVATTFGAPGTKWTTQFLAKYGTGTVISPSSDRIVLEVHSASSSVVGNECVGIRVGIFSAESATPGRVWVDVVESFTSIITTVLGPAAVGSDAFHNVKVGVTFGSPLSSSSVTIDVDGTSTTQAVDLSGLPSVPTVDEYPYVWFSATVPTQAVQVCSVPSAYASHWYGTHTSQCDLDPGLNEMDALPHVRSEDSWEVLKKVAAAEFGVIGFNEDGRFFFKNRDTARAQALTADKSASTSREIKACTLTERADGVRNVIVMSAARRFEHDLQIVYEAKGSNDLLAYPGTSRFTLTLTEPSRTGFGIWKSSMTAYTTTATWYAPADPPWTANFPAFLANEPGANNDVGNVAVTILQSIDGETFQVEVVNSNAFPIRFSTTDGKPAFKVSGLKLIDESPTIRTYRRESSITTYGERTLTVGSNAFAQRHEFLEAIGRALLKDLKSPVPIIDRIPVVGDPRLQLGDTVDLTVTGQGPMPVVVTSITRSLTATGGLTDELGVRPFAAPGKWILGHSTYSVLASTTVLG